MKLKVIDEKTYKEFALKNPYISIYQLPEWGKLKAITGWVSHLVGLYAANELKGVTLLLQKKVPFNKNLFYAPRGYLLDVADFQLLKEFHEQVIEYVKNNNGFMLKVDPNVIYAIKDKDGENKRIVGQEIFANFGKLGFKHHGFTQNFEDLQPRNLCRFKLQPTYEETLQSFSKSTKKNIAKPLNMGVAVRVVDSGEIDEFMRLLRMSADKNEFVLRPTAYYQKMVELMPEYIKLYITYIDTAKYVQIVNDEYTKTKKELADYLEEMKRINNGSKVVKHHQDLVNKLAKLKSDIEYAKKLQAKGEKINIGALMSLFIGNEGITFMSGIDSDYKEFNPKYAFYNQHIQDALKLKKEYVNFYGVSASLDKDNPYYHIYEIKKGFNPEMIELLGEFDYVINKFNYYMYKVSLSFYKVIKKIKR